MTIVRCERCTREMTKIESETAIICTQCMVATEHEEECQSCILLQKKINKLKIVIKELASKGRKYEY